MDGEGGCMNMSLKIQAKYKAMWQQPESHKFKGVKFWANSTGQVTQSSGGTKVSQQDQFDSLKPISNRMDIVLIEIEANKSTFVNSLHSSGNMENKERVDSPSTSISKPKQLVIFYLFL